MKKILFGAGSLALAAVGFIATKANTKFTAVTTGEFISTGTTSIGHASSLGSGFTTISNSGTKKVFLMKTNGTGAYTFLATLKTSGNLGAKTVYHN